MARAILELIGDADSLLRSFRKSSEAADKFGGHLKQLSVTAEQSARAQVEATVRKDARLRQEIATYRQVASAAKRGSREQVAAANLATRSEERLSRSLAITSREARAHARSVAGAERELGRFGRGAVAGSGVARSLGRSLAFASGGFLAFASAGAAVRQSIDAATEASAKQRQLAAQFRASGQSLGTYRKQIEDTSLAVSRLSGFNDTELTQSFTTAFRATQSTSKALAIERASADAARGSHKDLQTITLALTRAWGGASTSLRRLGILIPKTAKGMDAITFVQRRFAGQAQAGTTAQERFAAALHNTEVSIGTGILPQLNKYLNRATVWLDNSANQARIQQDVNQTMRDGKQVLSGFAAAIKEARAVLSPLVHLLGGTEDAAKLAGLAFLVMKGRTAALALGLSKANAQALTLRGRLLGLSKIGPIAIAVALELVPKSGKGQNVLNSAGLGFAGKLPVIGHLAQQSAVAGNAIRTGLGRSDLSRRPRGAPKPPPGYDPLTYGMAPSTKANPGGYLKIGTAPAGFQPGTYGQAPSTRRNPGGFLPLQHARAAATTPGALGFKARFATAELALAQAQLTKAQADDKKILQLEAALLRERIKTLGTSRKTLAERTQLTQQLVGVEGQITEIGKKGLSAEQKAAREAYRLRLLALRNQAQRLAAEKSADAKELSALKQRDQALTGKIKQLQDSFKAAVATAREGIGGLFAGPVLNFSDEQRKAALGIPNTAADPKALVRDLRAQVQAEAARQRNINRIQKRLGLGRNSRLITELRGNTSDAVEVAGLAHADTRTLRAFSKQFAGRERLAQNIARADMRVGLANLHIAEARLRTVRVQENHFTIYINDVEQKQAKVRVKQSAAQRRGPVPGRS